uniref:Aminomethyltransferase folate-binding domain-containing protein n=1 Tax=Fibrocapsa japonica TaxID=94617 RepID=A0A7S2V2E1_9STRA
MGTIFVVPSLDGGSGPAKQALVLVSPHIAQSLAKTFDKFIFPADKVSVHIIPAGDLAIFSTAMPLHTQPDDRSRQDAMNESSMVQGVKAALKELNHDSPTEGETVPSPGKLYYKSGVVLAGTSGLRCWPGYTFLVPAARAASAWKALVEADHARAAPLLIADQEWHALRVMLGRGWAGKEYSEDYNVLEAGLYHTISFTKGCYIGQETIAKVNNFGKPKTQIFGLQFDSEADVHEGDKLVTHDGLRAGRITTMLPPTTLFPSIEDDRIIFRRGLGFIRKQAGEAGLQVTVERSGAKGIVVNIPEPTRSDIESQSPPVKKVDNSELSVQDEQGKADAAKAAARKAAEDEAEAQRKEAKLAAMQARLAAFQAKKKKKSGSQQ